MAGARFGVVRLTKAEALQRLMPVVAVVALVVAFFASGLNRYLSVETLHDNDIVLRAFVNAHPFLSGATFIAAYALVIGLSLPGGAIMTTSGGFLFGLWAGATLSVVGAAAGAIVIFLIARQAAGDLVRARAGLFVTRMAEGFERNAFSYLLFLRLVPLFPFWAVNLVPALLDVRLRPFAAATVIGIIPAALAYASLGDGLGRYFAAGTAVPFEKVFSPEMIAIRVGFALLALLPVAIRWLRRRSRL